ncbi:MAG: glycosyltransferase [Halioglobus sp.]|nr:glycosyltransferase [Halioglobus sp.]
MRRWQDKADITLYTTIVDDMLLEEYGLDRDKLNVNILPVLSSDEDKYSRRFDLVEDMLILPRIWEFSLGRHDVYFLNGAPTHLVRCSPSVFMCHEPLRMLYDLRYQFAVDSGGAQVHVYPEQKYRQAEVRGLEIQLELIESVDRQAEYDYLAVNSAAIGNYLHNVSGRTANVIAYPGVNPVPSAGPPAAGKRAIYVGRLWHHKRVDLLVRAIAELEQGYLDIVGEGPELDTLQAMTEKLAIEDRVVFHGALSNAEVAALYKQATCGVYMPVREPFGMMPLEAAAAGLPVIVAPEGGYSEILDERAAFTVSPTPKAIARALQRLFEDPELAARRGQNAQRCTSNLTWDNTADDLYSLFEEAVIRERQVAGPEERTLVGAHYYPWYDAGRPLRHWNENDDHAAVSDLPLTGAYTSYDPGTAARHVELAERAGIDFLTIDWEVGHRGLNPKDLEATRQLFAQVKASGSSVRLTIMLSVHTSLIEPLEEAIRELTLLSCEEAWLPLRGKPVIWFFLSADFLGCYYAHKEFLEQACAPFNVLTAGAVTAPHHLPADVQEFVKGWSLYVPFRSLQREYWEEEWALAYKQQVGDGHAAVRIFTVSPGYDDAQLTAPARENMQPRRVPRNEGETYRRMLNLAMALDPAPEIIMITSFNEYHEGTHIEPSFAYDEDYLEQTRVFTHQLRSRGRA